MGKRQPSPVTLATLHQMKGRQRFACLTAYDATFTQILEQAGVEVLLVGDSLGMVIQGHDTTVPVTVDDVIYHSRCVARAQRHTLLMADMPFMSYTTAEQALDTAARLMQEGGAQVVKLEGNAIQAEVVHALTGHGVPVCAHLGLTPQFVHRLGGYRVQGRGEAADRMLADARTLEDAGADLLLLECVPAALAAEITAEVAIPVIGIGAGAQCDGQVLVLHDMLGLSPRRPRFVRNFMANSDSVPAAVERFVAAVKDGSFPAAEHTFD